MVLLGFGAKGRNADAETARAEAPTFAKVNWRHGNLRKLYWHCAILSVASVTTGFDGMMVNTAQLMDPWQSYFDHPTKNILGLIGNAFNIGSIVSFFTVPFFADRFGRKMPIAMGCVIMITGGLVTTFAKSWEVYVAGRVVMGFGNSYAQMCSPILLTEIAHPQHRAPLTAVYNCLWNVGALLVAWVGLGTMQARTSNWSWRSIALLQILPAIVQLAGLWWVPESPRFLIHKNKPEKALEMLAYYHADGDASNATVQFEYKEIKETLALEQTVLKETSYLDFFRTKGNRWRLAIIVSLGVFSQYSGSAIFSNYSNLIYEGAGIKSQTQKGLLNGGSTLLSLIVSVTASSLIDRTGRRLLFLLSGAGMCVMFTIWTILVAVYENSNEQNAAAGYAQIPVIWIFGVFYSIAWSGLLVAYAIEVLPYKLRAKGLMIMNIAVQAILAMGNQTNPVAWAELPHHWNLTLIYTIWLVVELTFVYFVYVETKGPTLEEIAKIFDGDSASAHIDLRVVEKEIESGNVETVETVENEKM